MSAPSLEVTFDASGAAEAGRRTRVVCVVDVVDASTTAEAALAGGALAVLGAAPAEADPPVPVRPDAVGMRAVAIASERGAGVVVAAEPRVGSDEERLARARPVVQAVEGAGLEWELVANQGAEIGSLATLEGRVVVVVSTTGGAAYDAALEAGAPAGCFATTARVGGLPGRDVAARGARRAMDLAERRSAPLTLVAASANSLDDVLAAGEIARLVIESGYLALPPS